jgi:hypothetical protein
VYKLWSSSLRKLLQPATTSSLLGPNILLSTRMALGPTQPPIQLVPGALSLGVKQLGREADHSLPSSAEVKEWVELYLQSPNTPSWCSARLKKISTGTTRVDTQKWQYLIK